MTTKLYNLRILRTQEPPKPHKNYGHSAKFPSSLSFSRTLKRDHSNVTEQRHWDLSTNCNFPNIWGIFSDLRDYQNDQPCMHFFFLLVVLLGFWSPGNSSRALHVPGKNYQSINVSPEHALFIYQLRILWRFHVVCLSCTVHLSEPSSRSEAGIYITGLI